MGWRIKLSMVGVDFSPYLKFVCTTPRYQETLSRYTVTDAIHLVLEAQTVVREESEGREREEPRQQVERFPVLEGLRKYAATDHVLLSGKPGSGKSTTLKRLLLEMAKANLSPQPPLLRGEGEQDLSLSHREREIGGEGKIPVLVQLKSNRPILEAIRAEFRQGKLSVSTEQIDHWLLDGKIFLLLDGVNEIPSEELRQQLQQFREDNPHTPMIFTTRDLAVGGDLGIEQKLEMRPLTEAQMREFVGKYLPEYGDLLLRQLEDRLREVGETPLLLKMLCEVFDPQTQQIPKSKGELFRAFDRKYNQHKQNPPVSGDCRRFQSEVLQHLAFEMVRGDSEKPTEAWLTVPRWKAEGILEAWLGKRGVADAPTKAKKWLEDLLEHHLLQVAADPSQIEFHHQLFQEYYAAEALLARVENRHPDVMDDERLQHFFLNYLKWTEPVALMVALLGDEAQAVRVVRLALDVDLKLGARLAGEVKPEFQGQTVARVSALDLPDWFKFELWGITRSEVAIPELLQALEDENSFVRGSAAEALGKIGSHQAILGLLQALEDEDFDVRWKAAEALGKLGLPEAILRLLEALQNEDFCLGVSEAQVLGNLGLPKAIPGLLQAIEDEYFNVLESEAQALGKIGSPEAMPGLLQALTDEDSSVRERAVYALGKLGSPEATPRLIQALTDKHLLVRWRAAEVLGKLGSPEAIPGLIEALTDEDSSVREKATQALGQIKQDKAAHILPHLLALIPSELGEEAFYAISGIQQNCQFYNYEIFRKQLPPVVSPQQSTDDSMLKALQQINQGVQKMSETPKQDFTSAIINGNNLNFASNYGSQDVQHIEKNDGTVIGKQVQASPENLEQLVFDFQQFITSLQQKYPKITDETAIAQIIDVEAKLIETKEKPRFSNILNLKRLWNGSKKAAIKIGEHFVEENPWGKGAIAFLEGVSEEIE